MMLSQEVAEPRLYRGAARLDWWTAACGRHEIIPYPAKDAQWGL
jgi:hypothetical protein